MSIYLHATVSCDSRGCPHQLLLSHSRATDARRIAKRAGWVATDSETRCPSCLDRRRAHDDEAEVRCVNAHDRCYGGAGGPCPYCEPKRIQKAEPR